MTQEIPVNDDKREAVKVELMASEPSKRNAVREAVADYLEDEAEPLEDFLSPHGAEVLRLAADVLRDVRSS